MTNMLRTYIDAWLAKLGQEEGQTLVEYALIIALVSIALVTALGLLTGSLTGVFTTIQGALDGAGA